MSGRNLPIEEAKWELEMESFRSSCRRCRSKFTIVILRSSWPFRMSAEAVFEVPGAVSIAFAIVGGRSGIC